jgi:hypothetical protein
MIALFLMLLAAVLFFLSAIGVPDQPRFRLISAGLFCWVVAEIIGRASGVH